MTDLWYGTSGPSDAPIVIVGESWGSEEARIKKPFVGSSGTELDRILAAAGLNRNEILCTNVVAHQPLNNEMWRLFEPKASHNGPRIGGLTPSTLVRTEVARLYNQITAHPRKVVIAAGNWSLWALSPHTGSEVVRESNGRKIDPLLQTWGPTGIYSWRGSMTWVEPHSEFFSNSSPMSGIRSIPLLPIVHPAAVMRQWSMREPTIHDLKTRVPMALRSDWRPDPEPHFLAPPTFSECVTRLKLWLSMADRGPLRLTCDIETAKGFITCLGLCDSIDFAICIPFIRKSDQGGLESYWNFRQEAAIINLLRFLFRHPNVLIQGQNFIYDTQYIQHYFGVTPHVDHDTMLCQNVVFPGTPKDLSYLSSLYCRYHWYWKEDAKEWDGKGSLEQLLQYNCLDLIRTHEVADNQRILLQHLGMQPQMDFKMQTNHMCLRMMNRGVLIDTQRRNTQTNELSQVVDQLHSELLQIIPQDWIKELKKPSDPHWVTSDKQTKEVFYDLLGFKQVNHRKTGNATTGKEAIMQFKKWYPEFYGLLDRLDTVGSVEQIVNVLKTPLDPDNRIRCSYNPGGTETHRLSSSKNAFGRGTNLQNLTKGEEDE